MEPEVVFLDLGFATGKDADGKKWPKNILPHGALKVIDYGRIRKKSPKRKNPSFGKNSVHFHNRKKPVVKREKMIHLGEPLGL